MPWKKSMPCQLRGFTLIEILVTLGVLAILAAIAIPAYQDYVVRSRVAEGFEFADASRIQVILRRMEGGNAAISKGFDSLEKPAGHVVSLRWVAVTNASPQGDSVIGYLMPAMNLPGLAVRDAFALEYLANGDWRCVNAAVAAGHSMLSQNQALEDKYLPALCRSGAGMMAQHPKAPAGCPPQPAQVPDATGKMQQVCQSAAPTPQQTTSAVTSQPKSQADCQPHQHFQAGMGCNNVCNPGWYYVPSSSSCSSTPPAQPQLAPQQQSAQPPAVQCAVGQDCTHKDPKCPAGQEFFAGGQVPVRGNFDPFSSGSAVFSMQSIQVAGGCVAKCQNGYVFNPKDPATCGVAPATNVHLCKGPKFICERAHQSQGACPADAPYAASHVHNLSDGSRYVTKSCITQNEAFDAYAYNLAHAECAKYNVDNLQGKDFKCTFACLGDACNKETVPQNQPRWDGRTKDQLPSNFQALTGVKP